MKHYQIMPSLDLIDLYMLDAFIDRIEGHPSVCGFKIGFALGLAHGLRVVCERIKRRTDKPLIYDHQKAGTDIPETGSLFAATMRHCGIDKAILFPQAGPMTERAWIKALKSEEVGVIVGGLMTHPAYLTSEGGNIDDDRMLSIYEIANQEGVVEYVVPLTKPALVGRIIERIDCLGEATFYSPGYGSQGGDPRHFPTIGLHIIIVGRSLLGAPDPLKYLDRMIEGFMEVST